MEHWEELKPGGFRFVWDDSLFRPVTDTFLLSSYPRLKPGFRVCDLGSGTGLLGLLLLQRAADQGGKPLDVTGLEIQEQAAALAEQCAAVNGLDRKISVNSDGKSTDKKISVDSDGKASTAPDRERERGQLHTLLLDLREVRRHFPPGGFDLAVSNPPYYEPGRGKQPGAVSRRLARSEKSCALADVIHAAAWLLRTGGAFCLCHRPERLVDVLSLLREAGCEAKRLRFVCPRPGAAPSLFLAEGRRGGKPGLAVEPDLVLCQADGMPGEELNRIYFR